MSNKIYLVTVVTLLFIISHMIVDVKFTSEIKRLEQQVNLVSNTNQYLQDELVRHASFKRQLECMAMNVYHEARSETYDGQLAVATVTMNRVKSGRFPNTVCGVVWQKNNRGCQFSWTCDGKSDMIRNTRAYREATQIAEKVMIEGVRSNGFSRDVLFYHANYANPSWAISDKMIRIAQIDTHLFYKLIDSKS